MKLNKLLLFLFLLTGFTSACQNSWSDLLKNYFLQQPIDLRFSTFINSIQKDTSFSIDYYERRNDSNFFYFSGTYKYFNPFRFTASEVRLVVAEDEFMHSDSLKTIDTVINLQMIGTLVGNSTNEAAVQKEFNRFHKLYGKNFSSFNLNNIKRNEKIVAEIYSYFEFPYSISPVSVAWGTMSDSNECTFAITIRFKLSENQATRILPPNGF